MTEVGDIWPTFELENLLLGGSDRHLSKSLKIDIEQLNFYRLCLEWVNKVKM